MSWFFHNMTFMAKTLLDGTTQEEELPPDASNYEVRTKALTRPAYLQQNSARATTSACTSARASARVPKRSPDNAEVSAGTEEETDATVGPEEDRLDVVRQSPLTSSVYARYKMSLENRSKVEQAKAERLARDEVRESRAQEQHERIQKARARVLGRSTAARRHWEEVNNDQADTVRQERMDIRSRIEHNEDELLGEMRARVDEGRGGYASKDARLDAQEEAAAEARRQEHSEERRFRLEELRVFRQRKSEERRQAAGELRLGTQGRMADAFAERHRRNAEAADEKRRDTARVQARSAVEKQQRLSRAGENRDRIRTDRANASRKREEYIRQKVLLGTQIERFDDAQIAEAKEEIRRSKQEVRDAVYADRYVSREEADFYSGTEFERLYAMDEQSDAEIAAANVELLARIENVAQRTDDDVDDDAAGEMRAKFAAKSRAEKARERARITRDNEAHAARMHEQRHDTEAALARRL